MEENLHRKLVEKLRREEDYPGFSNQGWLSLESRLERFDRRRRFWGWFWLGLPLAALFGLNLYLLFRPAAATDTASALSEQKQTTYLFDTIVNKVTVYQYDTIFRKIYRDVYTSSVSKFNNGSAAGAFSESNNGTTGNLVSGAANNGESLLSANGTSDPVSSAAKEVPVTFSGKNGSENASSEAALAHAGYGIPDASSLQPWDSAFKVPYVLLLPFEISSRRILATKTTGHHQAIHRLPLLRRMDLGISAGVLLAQKGGASGSPGLRISLDNEFTIGQDNWTFWQSLGWQQLKLKSKEKSPIPGFAMPPSPDPNASLEKVLYDRKDLSAQLGISYHFKPVKHLTPYLGMGLGGYYRLSGDQLTDYENHDPEEHFELPTAYGSGWSGLSVEGKAGFTWQFQRLLQFRLQASYSRMLEQSLAEGNIDQWWGLNATILYRWR